MNLSKRRLENLALVAIVPFILVSFNALSTHLELSIDTKPKQCKVYHASAPPELRCQPMEESS
jgi:hypothetical protein